MKARIPIVIVALIALTAATTAAGATDDLKPPKPVTEMTSQDWATYSERIVEAIKSGQAGLQQSALRLSIQYAEMVDVTPAIVEVMAIYRNDENERVRHLAAVALGSMNSRLATNYLRLSYDFERSPHIQKTIKAMVNH